jgi:hypothetical protein
MAEEQVQGLRDIIESAYAESETDEQSSTPSSSGEGEQSPASETPAVPASVEGESKPKVITDVVGEEKSKPAVEPVPGETEEQREARSRVDRPPQSWKGDAKKVWGELPLTVRQEVARRELQSTRVMNESSQARQEVESVRQILGPHMGRIQEIYGGDHLQAISNLMQVENTLLRGSSQEKVQLVARMIKRFNVGINELDQELSGQIAPENQQFDRLQQMIDQRMQPVMTLLQQQQAQEHQRVQQIEMQAVQTVESMRADPDNYPYIEDVRNDMADLIEMSVGRGVAMSLDEAYSKAVRMNDHTFNASTVRSTSQANTQSALAAHQAAQRAKGAAVSVSGAPAGAASINGHDPSNLRGVIEAAYGFSGERI